MVGLPDGLASGDAATLVTPGEVMQLPPADGWCLSPASHRSAPEGAIPDDQRLAERVLAPPETTGRQGGKYCQTIGASCLFRFCPSWSEVNASGEARIDDPANAGIRGELPEHEEIVPERANPTPEFVFGEEDPDDDAVRARVLREQARGLARQAAMDPGDGIDL
jgi:type IV secretion system protein VirD4